VEIERDPAAAQRWTLQAVDMRSGYGAGVAVDGPATVTMRGDWQEPTS
jgi:hypothetical protein